MSKTPQQIQKEIILVENQYQDVPEWLVDVRDEVLKNLKERKQKKRKGNV